MKTDQERKPAKAADGGAFAAGSAKGALRSALRAGLYRFWYPARYQKKKDCEIDPHKILFLQVKDDRLSETMSQVHELILQQDETRQAAVCFLHEEKPCTKETIDNTNHVIDKLADCAVVLASERSRLLACLQLREETTVIYPGGDAGQVMAFLDRISG